MKNIKLFVTFVASLFFLFSCEKEKVETCGFDTYGHEIEMYTIEQGEKRDKRQ